MFKLKKQRIKNRNSVAEDSDNGLWSIHSKISRNKVENDKSSKENIISLLKKQYMLNKNVW